MRFAGFSGSPTKYSRKCTVTTTRTSRPTRRTHKADPERNPKHKTQQNANKGDPTSSKYTEIIDFFSTLPRSGRGGRRFKSCHSDQILSAVINPFYSDR